MSATAQDPTTSVVAYALAYARRGWPVFPLEPGGKAPLTDRKAAPRGVDSASTDEGQIRSWWGFRFPDAGIGVACGRGRHPATVQDFDDLEHEAARSALAGIDKATPRVRTPGTDHPPGWHYYFAGRYPNRDYPWGELRSNGKYVVAPPTRTDAGVYEWVVKPNGALPELPEFLRPPVTGPAAGTMAPIERVPHGERRAHLTTFAARLARGGIVDYERVLAHLLCEFEQFCEPDPPPSPGDLEGIARWVADGKCDIARREAAMAEFAARWRGEVA